MVWHPFGVVSDPVEKGSKKVELYGEFEGWKRKHEMGWIMFWLKGWRTAWKEQGRNRGKKKSVFCCLGFFVVKQRLWYACAEREESWRQRRKELIIFIVDLLLFSWVLFCCSCCGNHAFLYSFVVLILRMSWNLCIYLVSILLKIK